MSAKSITEFFERDHDRLDTLYEKFQELKWTDLVQACHYYEHFYKGMLRHMVWEEEVIFPYFEIDTKEPSTAPLRAQHEILKKAMRALFDKIQSGNPYCLTEEQCLADIMAAHNQEEERKLYPMLDLVISEQEREDVFRQMANLSRELEEQKEFLEIAFGI